jgi:hypothetical protein
MLQFTYASSSRYTVPQSTASPGCSQGQPSFGLPAQGSPRTGCSSPKAPPMSPVDTAIGARCSPSWALQATLADASPNAARKRALRGGIESKVVTATMQFSRHAAPIKHNIDKTQPKARFGVPKRVGHLRPETGRERVAASSLHLVAERFFHRFHHGELTAARGRLCLRLRWLRAMRIRPASEVEMRAGPWWSDLKKPSSTPHRNVR